MSCNNHTCYWTTNPHSNPFAWSNSLPARFDKDTLPEKSLLCGRFVLYWPLVLHSCKFLWKNFQQWNNCISKMWLNQKAETSSLNSICFTSSLSIINLKNIAIMTKIQIRKCIKVSFVNTAKFSIAVQYRKNDWIEKSAILRLVLDSEGRVINARLRVHIESNFEYVT